MEGNCEFLLSVVVKVNTDLILLDFIYSLSHSITKNDSFCLNKKHVMVM